MTRRSKFLAGTAAVLALVPIFGATISLAQAGRKVSNSTVEIEKELPQTNGGQRRLVRVVDVSNTPCGATGAVVDPNTLEHERLALLAHRSRLEAEIQGRDTIFIPEELRGRETTEQVQRPFGDEAVALQSRVAQLAEQIESVQQSVDLMKRENEVIQAKDTMMQRQVSLLQDQLDAVDGLLKRGSATVSQKLGLEQTPAQYESSHLDLQLSGLKSRQELLKAQQSIGDVRNQLRTQDLVELSQTQARLSDLSKDISAATKPAGSVCDQAPGPVFEVVRGADGAIQVLPIAPLEAPKPDSSKLPKAS
jgi:hypothetical protein